MTPTTPAKHHDLQQLDELTGGAFSAATSGERAACLREWLGRNPDDELLHTVYRELSVKDKGAAKLLREKLDELKRVRAQQAIAVEWADKAQALLQAPRLHIADALAWQRDAAKAGAPLGREPLLGLKTRLNEQIKAIEDLQHRVQVQREAAVLLAQRIEVLSTKPWRDAQATAQALRADVANWQTHSAALPADSHWQGVDVRFPPLLESAHSQLLAVWEAFDGALAKAVAAAADPTAALPPVPVWAHELKLARGLPAQGTAPAPKAPVDPHVRAQATAAVGEVLARLEQEISQGHGKASAGAAAALRNAIKTQARFIDEQLEARAHAALAAAGELEGWQRWRADQLREALVVEAEALLKRPEGQALGGRKMQETLRSLRERWKETDQGGVPNHALWRRFDEACNQAHKVVAQWIEKVKAESARHRAERLALIEEVKAWSAANPTARDDDWKGFGRVLHQFSERWRLGGHLPEKTFADLQAQWKAAIHAAAAPLEAMQQQSVQRRQAMIEEAVALGAAPVLRVDAVKALQQRWQAEAHAVALERRHEQKLWEAFRQPIDEAFSRKDAEREKATAALSVHDRAVLDAAKALEAACDSADAQKIRAAMNALDEQLRAQEPLASADKNANRASVEQPASTEGTQTPSPERVSPAPKPVRAVRGDDRPGAKRPEAVSARARPEPGQRGRQEARSPGAKFRDAGPMPPRLGDAAFRAQRDALGHAQAILKKLATQAHGEVLTRVLEAWERRAADLLPTAQELGRQVTPAIRTLWARALTDPASASDNRHKALLRLEMAADIPTPAADLPARRALQLELLTRRNDPAPAQTWGQDVAQVLGGGFDAALARRLQQAAKVLMRHEQ